uniref:Glycosyltransferase n=1 Tax=Oryza punctata TaxID=4537 RepID=A0A0E0LZX8_ORYPU
MASATLAISGSHGLPHLAIFPFMAKGHTIPLIQLVNYLRHHHLAAVTFFTTPANAAFVRGGLSGAGDDDDDVTVVELEFPADARGVESAEGLTSMASFVAFAESTSLLRPQFEASVAAMEPPASFIVADAFLYWTNESAAMLGVPKVSFLGTSTFAHVMRELIVRHDPFAVLRPRDAVHDDDGGPPATTFSMPEFPQVKLSVEELMVVFRDRSAFVPMMELDAKMGKAIEESHSLIINTFLGLEAPYIKFWNEHVGPRAWPVGPLCLAQPAFAPAAARPSWMEWLDKKAADGQSVLYIALGTLAVIPEVQLKEVAIGLERAEVDFIWAISPKDINLGPGFEERIKGKGIVVRDWVEQSQILQHKSVRGFLSHCGWNSVLESVTTGVPLAVWPMNFDQPFNARFLVDEMKIAVMVWTSDSFTRGLVTHEEISRVVTELMLGEVGVEATKNVAKLLTFAKKAVDQGGSSWVAVREMINELCTINVCSK